MFRRLVLAAVALALAGCASAREARVNRYCGVGPEERSQGWALLPAAPANAADYRAAASGARGGYHPPVRAQREYWLTGPGGVTRICILDARARYAPCSGGWWDVRETSEGLVSDGEGSELVCVT